MQKTCLKTLWGAGFCQTGTHSLNPKRKIHGFDFSQNYISDGYPLKYTGLRSGTFNDGTFKFH
jgi:hypothetical protein